MGAYTNGITDQNVQHPNRFKINGVAGQTIEPDFGVVTEAGTPVNRELITTLLAATGTTAGTASALTLEQPGFSLFDGATVRIKLHVDMAAGATLNVQGTGAEVISRPVSAEAGEWLTLTYSSSKNTWAASHDGIYPQITVVVTTGSTVTCSNGDIVLTATESSGAWVFRIPKYGIWTVSATKGSYTASDSVSVMEVKTYTLTLAYLTSTFASTSWTDIISACQLGFVPESWVPGNEKSMVINGVSHPVVVIGKNHDFYSNGGVAPLTFQLKQSYNSSLYKMNNTNTNIGGWTSCAMRNTHLPAILNLMPTEVKNAVREVNKLSSAGNQSDVINTTADKLFLLSEIEIVTSISRSKPGEGSTYAYYAAGNGKIKQYQGDAKAWWERSPGATVSDGFCYVLYDGSLNVYSSSELMGVSFGFCF